jgi:DNA segregation ATPase FtsK/SpoIIIE-like protein
MDHAARQDPLFEAVRKLVLETKIPSVAHIQIEFRINYSRAAAMLDALEGDLVTPKDEQGFRKMLKGEARERQGQN